MYRNQRALIVDRAKDLRKRSTEAETVLWEELRKRIRYDPKALRGKYVGLRLIRGFILTYKYGLSEFSWPNKYLQNHGSFLPRGRKTE